MKMCMFSVCAISHTYMCHTSATYVVFMCLYSIACAVCTVGVASAICYICVIYSMCYSTRPRRCPHILCVYKHNKSGLVTERRDMTAINKNLVRLIVCVWRAEPSLDE